MAQQGTDRRGRSSVDSILHEVVIHCDISLFFYFVFHRDVIIAVLRSKANEGEYEME